MLVGPQASGSLRSSASVGRCSRGAPAGHAGVVVGVPGADGNGRDRVTSVPGAPVHRYVPGTCSGAWWARPCNGPFRSRGRAGRRHRRGRRVAEAVLPETDRGLAWTRAIRSTWHTEGDPDITTGATAQRRACGSPTSGSRRRSPTASCSGPLPTRQQTRLDRHHRGHRPRGPRPNRWPRERECPSRQPVAALPADDDDQMPCVVHAAGLQMTSGCSPNVRLAADDDSRCSGDGCRTGDQPKEKSPKWRATTPVDGTSCRRPTPVNGDHPGRRTRAAATRSGGVATTPVDGAGDREGRPVRGNGGRKAASRRRCWDATVEERGRSTADETPRRPAPPEIRY
jgi:hypothetical protein